MQPFESIKYPITVNLHFITAAEFDCLPGCQLNTCPWLLTLSCGLSFIIIPGTFLVCPVITRMDCVCKIAAKMLCLRLCGVTAHCIVTSSSKSVSFSHAQEAPVCHNKTRASVSRVPSETCDLSPATLCRTANKLVPHLEPVEKCEERPRHRAVSILPEINICSKSFD